ncbi:hypothetical protein ABZP36_006245 [Zizania latifolia]
MGMGRGRMTGAAAAVAVAVLAVLAAPATGQVSMSCTASLVTTFTPCLNFVTGSTNGGGSPTQQCCGSLAEMIRTGADCACLILTGNVPFNLPINRALAMSLPKLCNSMSVPLQCRDTATQIPPAGPVAFAPALPPLRNDLALPLQPQSCNISWLNFTDRCNKTITILQHQRRRNRQLIRRRRNCRRSPRGRSRCCCPAWRGGELMCPWRLHQYCY